MHLSSKETSEALRKLNVLSLFHWLICVSLCHRSSGCGPTITYHRPSRNCTVYRSTRGSTTSCACCSTRRRSGRQRRTSLICWRPSPVCSHWALSAQPPTATTSCRVQIASLARGLFQSPHLKLETDCRPNWKRQPVPLSFKRSLKTFLFQSAYGCETRVSGLL